MLIFLMLTWFNGFLKHLCPNTNNVSVYGEQYGYNDNYPTKEIDKYECQTGPFEGFFTSSPEFCKSKVTPDRDRDGGSNQDNKLNLLEYFFI